MKINLEIANYTYGHNINSEGSTRHISFVMFPGRNEVLELETGESFSYRNREDENIPFSLTIYENKSDDLKDEPGNDKSKEKEDVIGVIRFSKKFGSSDGVVDEPSQIMGSISLPTSDFDELLDNLKRGYVPHSVSLEREFSIRDEDCPIKLEGYLGESSKWSNKDKDNQMVMIHNIGFGYIGSEDSNCDDGLQDDYGEQVVDPVEQGISNLNQSMKNTNITLNRVFKGIVWAVGIISILIIWLKI